MLVGHVFQKAKLIQKIKDSSSHVANFVTLLTNFVNLNVFE